MKKIIFILLLTVFVVSCTREEVQYGMVVDVELNTDSTWKAHIHYNDTICVYQDLDYEVQPGDSLSRIIKHYNMLLF